jgi:polygalacturonase
MISKDYQLCYIWQWNLNNRNMRGRIFIGVVFIAFLVQCDGRNESGDPWNSIEMRIAQIEVPAFPDRVFSILDFGAIADSITDCTEAFRQAIESCNREGGGRVIVPEGVYLSGSIHLLSNVDLHISRGATILFSKDYSKYLPLVRTRFEGNDLMNYSPLIYAYQQENIALSGDGTLDGNADHQTWWPWKGNRTYGWKEGMPRQKKARDLLFQMADKHLPVEERVFGEGYYLRPNFIQFMECKRILVSGLKIINSPMWEIHPVHSRDITIRNVRISSHGPNNDGFDPESSSNILVEGCLFDTGDDCIAIKSGREEDGRRDQTPSENIIIRDCIMRDGHGGVVVGSEISGGCRDVFVENCELSSPNLDRVLRIKTNSLRGGVIENIYMRNCTVGEVKQAILMINFYYEQGDKGSHDPLVRNIHLEGISSKSSEYALYLRGYKRAPISQIFLKDCRFDGVEKGSLVEHADGIHASEVYINGMPWDGGELQGN